MVKKYKKYKKYKGGKRGDLDYNDFGIQDVRAKSNEGDNNFDSSIRDNIKSNDSTNMRLKGGDPACVPGAMEMDPANSSDQMAQAVETARQMEADAKQDRNATKQIDKHGNIKENTIADIHKTGGFRKRRKSRRRKSRRKKSRRKKSTRKKRKSRRKKSTQKKRKSRRR